MLEQLKKRLEKKEKEKTLRYPSAFPLLFFHNLPMYFQQNKFTTEKVTSVYTLSSFLLSNKS